ncbi:MAG: DNA cytosine methyltransferase [Kiritimatiellaeota bacterium]|nr:DNA cytosine methyltransferase [Kiritimatiellota bacterium]
MMVNTINHTVARETILGFLKENPMPCIEGMEPAVVSHWIQNPEAKVYALFHDSFCGALSPQKRRKDRVADYGLQKLLFDVDVPFPPPQKPKFTFIDLFAGIGGIRMAMQNVGGKCVFSSEWDLAAQKTYECNYGEIPFGDITEQKIKDMIPTGFDMLCAGFPCQPFSISGRMGGFNDARGTLFFDICEIIKKQNPKVVLLENVKHLIHHNRGTTLSVILQSLEELGYVIQKKLLNASHFGVAQNRERIIIIGTKKQPFDFDAVKTEPRVFLHEVLGNEGTFEYLNPAEYTLIVSPKRQDSGLMFVGYRNKSIRKAGVRAGTEHLSRVHKQPNRIYSVEGLHPTLPSQESAGRFFILTRGNRVRKLTISECYNLMGFPSEFRMSPTPSAQYLQIGNSVCVPMIQAIGDALLTQGFV